MGRLKAFRAAPRGAPALRSYFRSVHTLTDAQVRKHSFQGPTWAYRRRFYLQLSEVQGVQCTYGRSHGTTQTLMLFLFLRKNIPHYQITILHGDMSSYPTANITERKIIRKYMF